MIDYKKLILKLSSNNKLLLKHFEEFNKKFISKLDYKSDRVYEIYAIVFVNRFLNKNKIKIDGVTNKVINNVIKEVNEYLKKADFDNSEEDTSTEDLICNLYKI
ncbi:hypothetical protein HERIO_378 [Hepatospora eriocheir]|uniref:Uncharacterized protein n=1 Tax=Hepatospora eriocheir TaxID=1081669 RepID=A0A1X0QDI6_9MICR|nr:hypothetical protein HERIO_378 [Hepatospora eriocheir]